MSIFSSFFTKPNTTSPLKKGTITIEILSSTGSCRETDEIITWMKANSKLPVRKVSIQEGSGSEMWRYVVQDLNMRTLPQVFMTYGKTKMHLGGLEGLKLALTLKPKRPLEQNDQNQELEVI